MATVDLPAIHAIQKNTSHEPQHQEGGNTRFQLFFSLFPISSTSCQSQTHTQKKKKKFYSQPIHFQMGWMIPSDPNAF
jgi:hypothetical protein